jgi:ABC-type multidrug transport system fused ATPase/permease subunit
VRGHVIGETGGSGLRLLWRAGRAAGLPLLGALSALRLLASLLPVAVALCMALLVQRVIDAASSGTGLSGALALPLTGFGATLLAGYAAQAAAGPLTYLAKARINGAHRTEVMRLVTAGTTLGARDQPKIQELIRDARADPRSWTERTPGDGAMEYLGATTMVWGTASAAAVLSWFAWWLAPLLVVPALANAWLRARHQGEFARLWTEQAAEGLHTHAWQETTVSAGAGKDLRTFGLGEWVVDRVGRHIRKMFTPIWAAQEGYARKQWMQFLLVAVPLLTVFLPFTALALSGEAPVGALVAVLTASWGVFQMAKSVDPRNIHGALHSLRAVAELRRLLDGIPEAGVVVTDRTPTPLPSAAPHVVFEDVTFGYPGTDGAPVLDGLDMEIRPGELLAIVGLNGAGKSTLIKLLAGLYPPDRGRITADGGDLRDLEPGRWQRRIHVAFQNFARYDLSLADNVSLCRGAAAATGSSRRELAAAAADAGLAPVLERLPDGWDTPLARSRSGGVDLSGGQWQQVALTRAFHAVRTGARLLVLDEPTAHLDVRTEAEVFSRLARRRGDAGVVLISHRLSSVRDADRIVLLDGGRITETGTHDDLIAHGGQYAALFAQQAERFGGSHGDTHHPTLA